MAKRKRSLADSGAHGSSRRKSKAKATPEPPPLPQYPYESDRGIPITQEIPDPSLLEEPLSVKESFALSHSLAQSRNRWLSGAMFAKFWTRPPRGRKLAEGEVNAREKMTKLCECLMAIGPHIFDVKLFIVKDESKDDDDKGSVEPDDKSLGTENEKQPAETEGQPSSHVAQDQYENSEKQGSTNGPDGNAEQLQIVQNDDKQLETKADDDIIDKLKTPEPEPTEVKEPRNASPPTNVESETRSTSVPVSEPNDKSELDPALTAQTPTAPQPSQASPSEGSKDATPAVPTDPDLPQSSPSRENSQSQDARSQRSPTPTAASVASNPNNMATIMKLQAIARIDRSLNSLMKIVASGNATPEQITAFQAYINGARAMELEDIPRFFKPVPDPDGPLGLDPTGKGKGKLKKDGAVRKPGKPRGRTAGKYQKKPKDGEPKKKDPNKPKNSYIPKKLQKKVTIVFEFKDNPADRYIIPKNSIIEVLPTNEVLISFLLLFPEGGISVKPATAAPPPGNIKVKKEDNAESTPAAVDQDPNAENPEDAGKAKLYYPLTVTLRNMPVKSLPILERSVNKVPVAANYMKEVMDARTRAKNWWVWFQIDKRDEEMLSQLVLPAKPPENMFIPARVRVYKSKKKSKDDVDKKKKKKDIEGKQNGTGGTTETADVKTEENPEASSSTHGASNGENSAQVEGEGSNPSADGQEAQSTSGLASNSNAAASNDPEPVAINATT